VRVTIAARMTPLRPLAAAVFSQIASRHANP
jgi:hypothetical protein